MRGVEFHKGNPFRIFFDDWNAQTVCEAAAPPCCAVAELVLGDPRMECLLFRLWEKNQLSRFLIQAGFRLQSTTADMKISSLTTL